MFLERVEEIGRTFAECVLDVVKFAMQASLCFVAVGHHGDKSRVRLGELDQFVLDLFVSLVELEEVMLDGLDLGGQFG